jgi:predicted enzyme related to lactoylglutathione lyase
MLRLDHLAIPVRDWTRSRDWYVHILGLAVEFEVPHRSTVAVHDQNDFTIFLVQSPTPQETGEFSLTFQVADVQASFEEISGRGGKFTHGPSKVFWGYGAELRDPDGYAIRLWDQESMKRRG